MQSKRILFLTILALLILTNNNCSIKKMAMNQVANALTSASSGSGNVFTTDNDPELVGDALPFTIKMYESLMVSAPWHMGLKLQTGMLYVMYANAFLQTPADMMPDERMEEQEFLMKRAKNLYLRGRDILLQALDKKYPGFLKTLNDKKDQQALGKVAKKDIDFLYWGAAGWLGAFALDPFDMKLGMTVPRANAMMNRVMELNPNYGQGAIHDFYVLYYGAMPDYMGGDFNKAREYYKKAVAASGGKSTSPHLSLATTVSVQEQNLKEFKKLLGRVLAVDVDADPENRLLNILNQRKARWLLDHSDNFFLGGPEDDLDENNDNGEEEE